MSGLMAGLTGASSIFGLVSGMQPVPVGIGPLFSRLSGQQHFDASMTEAGLLGDQATIAREEAAMEAARRAREVRSFKELQAVSFGDVRLEGSPLGVLEETARLGQMEVDAIKRAGEAQAALLEAQGLQAIRRGHTAAFTGEADALNQTFQNRLANQQRRNQAIQLGLQGLATGVGLAAQSPTFRRLGRTVIGRAQGIFTNPFAGVPSTLQPRAGRPHGSIAAP